MPLRQEVKAALPNRGQKQTQGGCPNEETKKYGPNERTEQNSKKKELNKMEINNLSDAAFKTLVIRMFKGFIGYFNSIKKPRQK